MSGLDSAGGRWRAAVAIVWLWGFLVFFYSLTPPNNPDLARYNVWREVPFELLDAVDPPQNAARSPSGWRYFPQRFDLMLTAAVILAGAWGLGHLCLRMIHPPLERRCAERTVFALALGLAALSLLTLFCGLAGLLVRELFAAVIASAVIAEGGLRLRDRRRLRDAGAPQRTTPRAVSLRPPESPAQQELRPPTSRPPGVGRVKWLFLLAMAPFLLAMLLGSMLPSTDFDVREYHLQGPKEFYQAGRIGFLPHNVYTSFPFFTEMLSLLAMTLRGDWFRGALAGKAVLMCFGPLTGLALYAAGRRWFGPLAGWLAALVYLTMPWTFRISTIAYAEGGLTFYLFAALFAFGIAAERLRDEAGGASRMFFVCGLLAGCAMACKYTGVVSVVIPLFAATLLAAISPSTRLRPFLFLKGGGPQNLRTASRIASLFLLGTAVTIGPWLVKNVAETGNPVYPLMYTVFGGRDWDADLNAKWRAGHSPPNYTDLPERALEVTAGNDWLTPLLWGLAPLSLLWWSLWCRRPACGGEPIDRSTSIGTGEDSALEQPKLPGKQGRLPCVGYLWLYVLWLFFTWWGLTHRIDRFWVPMTPVVALLAGVGGALAYAISNTRLSIAWRIAAGSAVVAALLFNLALIVSGASGNNTFLVDLDRAQQPPPGIAFLNSQLPAGARVLMVGEAQVFDAEFPLVYNTVFDHSIFEQWFSSKPAGGVPRERPLRDSDEIRRKLRDEDITHLFVNWQEIQRYRTTYGYTEFVTPRRFDALVERGVLGDATTLAVVLDTDLWQRVNSRQEAFRSQRLDRPGGGPMLVYSVHRELSPQERRDLQNWGAALLIEAGGRTLFITGQIFAVLP